MTYIPVFPPATTSPKLSPTQIQTNYSQFAAIFSSKVGGVVYNHLPLNDFNQGKHGSVLFQNQTLDPGVTNNYTVLYSKTASSAAGSQPQLFSQIPKFLPVDIEQGNEPNLPQQMTYNTVNTAGPDQFQSFLPGGYILYFGSTVTNAVPITLSPTPTKILAAFAYPQGTQTVSGVPNTPYATAIAITQPGTLKINAVVPGGGNPKFLWMAIAQA